MKLIWNPITKSFESLSKELLYKYIKHYTTHVNQNVQLGGMSEESEAESEAESESEADSEEEIYENDTDLNFIKWYLYMEKNRQSNLL